MKLAFTTSLPSASDTATSGILTACDLIILPELALSDRQPFASDGPVTAELRMLCRQAGRALLFGYEEACSGEVFNAAQMIDGFGNAIANYRCSHPSSEHHGVGRWLTIVPQFGRKIGLLLGDDLLAPEAWRALSLSGADLIIWSGRDHDRASPVLHTRALENGVAVAGMDKAGAHAFASSGREIAIEVVDDTYHILMKGADHKGPPIKRQPILYRRLTSETGSDA